MYGCDMSELRTRTIESFLKYDDGAGDGVTAARSASDVELFSPAKRGAAAPALSRRAGRSKAPDSRREKAICRGFHAPTPPPRQSLSCLSLGRCRQEPPSREPDLRPRAQ